ncbi:MAG: tyrosine-type recombinase/integrase [Alphaproteobacteria bacterium]
MAKVVLPFLEKTTAKGRTYYRYRRGGVRLPLPDEPDTPEFIQAYQRIHASFGDEIVYPNVRIGSIDELIIAFRKSPDFLKLKAGTKEHYLYHFNIISPKLGKFQARDVTRRIIKELHDSLASTPAKANGCIKAISRLYTFGIDREMVTINPAQNIKKLKLGEIRPWTPEEVELVRTKADPHIQLATALALFTGQRLGDVAKMRWDQIVDDGIEIAQQKTGSSLWVPLHPELKDLLERTKAERLGKGIKLTTILLSAKGLEYTSMNLKHKFGDALRVLGLPKDCVFHGLRKTAAVMLAEAGCSTEQIKAITGHRTDQMAAYYAKRANQRILAKSAMVKWTIS